MKIKLLFVLLLLPTFIFAQTKIGFDIDGVSYGDKFGNTVAISDDGSILAVGAPHNQDNGIQSGHVRVFNNNNGTWVQMGNTLVGENAYDRFGTSVSLSSDGLTLAVGAPLNDSNGNASGEVRVYTFNNGLWTQKGSDINGKYHSYKAGTSVSLSSDGLILAVGTDGFASSRGLVSIYKYQNNSWSKLGSDIIGLSDGDRFGTVVSLSSNGEIVAIGAYYNSTVQPGSGHAAIYQYNSTNNTWNQLGTNLHGQTPGAYFGRDVSLSNSGHIVAIGASDETGNASNSGVVRTYIYNNNSWELMGLPIHGDESWSGFGQQVDLSATGLTLTIGAHGHDGELADKPSIGQVKIFRFENDSWNVYGNPIDGEATGDNSGYALALSADETTLVIGATENVNENGDKSGHVRVYDTDIETLGLNNESRSTQFKIYPNPANNQVNIQLQKGLEFKKVNIYSTLGQLINTSKEKIINTTHLSPGMYLIEIETNQGNVTKQLIKE
ncbi:MAG: hypothetical protein CMP05_03290 [Xanthomarina sp.]|uniref:T9SS type A sorting domain-containing protein n=1 Tax=Xanthomarina sp. TaxID=1931211 RepID=UPI000C6AA43E|nr:T9SS type A sorting domain-containing protein [Xanthomarina sp.]MAL22462.1 hypothetical protein [Xanthomarina sp.]MBF61004.1 hypothetical protein [Xanthomarina sp.]HAB26883.1 hypothetical protein [Xanthomarina gelatinilytica]